ncbi:MAG TPA: acyltransferase [Acidimicrobiia bacterium]|nr:acyltransferase [Acidimicrobiia bacterium]
MAHLRSLDGLRGVAVLAVVLYHFAPGVAPGGFLGVDIFFVLSGFLITSLLVGEFESAHRISLAAFWGRRGRRLLPALFVVLGAVGIYALVIASPVEAHSIANDGLATFSYLANWHFISSGQSYLQHFSNTTTSPLRHMWSLAIEEQFYFVWPLVVAGAGAFVGSRIRDPERRRRLVRRTLVTMCLVLGVASLLRMVTLYRPGGDPSRVYYGTDTHASVLLIGAALGALTAGAPAIVNAGRRLLLVIIGSLAAIALLGAMLAVATDASWLYQGGYGLVALAVVVVLAAAAQPGKNPLARLLETRALVGLGLISYGVYLWHWPIYVWLTTSSTGLSGPFLFIARSAVTLAVSLASYYLVELPIRRGRLPRWHLRTPGVAPLTVVTVVAVVLLIPALTFPSVAAVPGDRPSKATFPIAARYAATPRCDTGTPRPSPLTTAGHPLRLQLVGNSLAGEMIGCLGTIVRRSGASQDAITQTGDAICRVESTIRSRTNNPKTHPDAAVLFELPIPDSQFPPSERCPTSRSFDIELANLLTMWKRAGVHVFLVPDVPPARQSTPDATLAQYQAAAQRDPSNVTVVDGGQFIRDVNTQYQWRMPCLPGGEPGCDAGGGVAVRWPVDGVHFCSDPEWSKHLVCAPRFGGGERRVAAAIATSVHATMQAAAGRPTR